MTKSILEEYQVYLKEVGEKNSRPSPIPPVFQERLIRFSGPDALDFLQRLTTQDIKNLALGECAGCALLTGNGLLISFFQISQTEDGYVIGVESSQFDSTFQSLEKFHFTEDLTIAEIRKDDGSGDASRIARSYSEGFLNALRADLGLPKMGIDITVKNLILEAPLRNFVSREKGCYPGQEVVERVFTYGNVAKKLVSLTCLNAEALNIPPKSKISFEGKEIGEVTSSVMIPWKKSFKVFAILRKPYYKTGQKVEIEGSKEIFEVEVLPHSFLIEEERDQLQSPASV